MDADDPLVEGTSGAVLLAWEGLAALASRDARRLGPLVEGLCAQGVEVVVVGGRDTDAVDRSLGARPGGPGHLHLCVGAGPRVDRVTAEGPRPVRGPVGRSARGLGPVGWALAYLATRGIGPGLVLQIGDDLGPVDGAQRAQGGASAVAALDAELRRHRAGVMPRLDEQPGWTVCPEGVGRRARQSLLTLGAAGFGTRGASGEEGPSAGAGVLAAGVYDGSGAEEHLLPGPVWTTLDTTAVTEPGSGDRTLLDLRSGVLWRLPGPGGGVASLRFAAAARPGVVVLRAAGPGLRGGSPLTLPEDVPSSSGRQSGQWWAATRGVGGGITAVAAQRVRRGRVERSAAYLALPPSADPCAADARAAAARTLREARGAGFGPLLAEQRERWARQWADCHVAIPDDPESELALRLALFHLLGSAGENGEAAVGARGLSGPGYRGHVFWDADVFVLPALAAVRPRSARVMLEYRLRRLGAARARAASEGRAGARFPWESGRDGTEITPSWAADPVRPVAILTGDQELHIVADIAWAACRYTAWTGDQAFLAGRGRPLVVEAARYWTAHAHWDGSGRAHIEGVIGPDEYHTGVNDNAFTNVMARWNLRAAAALGGTRASADERAEWSRLAEALVDGYDPATGTHEQFRGFGDLEPFSFGDLAGRPFAADVLLGPEVVARAQIVKQADVIMAHHLVPDDLPEGSLAADLDRYLPITSHGSSLSPGVHASVLARAGRPQDALRLFRVGARIDLDDLARTTGAGVHLAAMGGLWQAYAQGFLGVVPTPDGLRVDPHLPDEWGRAELGVRYCGARVRVSVDGGTATVVADRAIPVVVGESTRVSRGLALRGVGSTWSIDKEMCL